MTELHKNSKEEIVAGCRERIAKIFELPSQNRTLKPGTEHDSTGVFQEIGLYEDEFKMLRDSIFELFQNLGADETEKLIEEILFDYREKLSRSFIEILLRLVRLSANQVRASKAKSN